MEDKPQFVSELFKIRTPPCDIDRKYLCFYCSVLMSISLTKSLLYLYYFSATLISELTFKYEVLHRFINMDETHHKKSSEGDRGDSRSTTLTNANLPRAGTLYSKDPGNHVSGCY